MDPDVREPLLAARAVHRALQDPWPDRALKRNAPLAAWPGSARQSTEPETEYPDSFLPEQAACRAEWMLGFQPLSFSKKGGGLLASRKG